MAGLDDVVAEVAVARQPNAPADHEQVTAEAAEVQRLSRGEALNGSKTSSAPLSSCAAPGMSR